jgi:hypothetical protein
MPSLAEQLHIQIARQWSSANLRKSAISRLKLEVPLLASLVRAGNRTEEIDFCRGVNVVSAESPSFIYQDSCVGGAAFAVETARFLQQVSNALRKIIRIVPIH